MRKALFLLLSLFIVFALVSCSGDVANNDTESNTDADGEEYLCVITNLGENVAPRARSIGNQEDAPDIIGVLLKYHKEGLYNPNTSDLKDKFNNKNAFYVEWLDGEHETHYGMKFNYVLYVPDKIQERYEKGNGRNPNSGNAFWWYMSTYYGKGVNVIKNNWEPVIEFLLDNQNKLAVPKAKDVTGSWNKDWGNKTDVSNGTALFSQSVGIWYYEEANRDKGIDPASILYFEDGRYSQKPSKGNEKKQIFIPTELLYIYFSGSGVDDTLQALLWYFDTYYHVDNETVCNSFKNGTFGTLLAECKEKYGNYPVPKGDDILRVEETHPVEFEKVSATYFMGATEFYSADILVLSDGSAVQDKERVYYSINESTNKISLYFPEGYIDQLKDVYEEKGYEFSYNGDLLWKYMDWFCTDEEKAGTGAKNKNVSATVINKLLDYRVSTGLGDPINLQ